MPCCVCGAEFWDDNQNPLITDIEGDEYCILHAPIEYKDHEDLMNVVWERINCVFEKNLDKPQDEYETCSLDYTVFGEFSDFCGLKFPKTNFYKAIFSVVDFSGSEFCSDMGFEFAVFKSQACFIGAEVRDGGSLDYSYCVFQDEAIFQSAVFDGYVSFFRTTFEKNAEFTYSKQNMTPLSPTITFREAMFIEASLFLSVDYKSITCFDRTHFCAESDFTKSKFGGVSFRNCIFEEQAVFDRVDLRRTQLIGAPVEKIRFIACVWPIYKNKRIVFDSGVSFRGRGYFRIENIGPIGLQPKGPPPEQLADLFRRLKKVAQQEQDQTLASDFHYGEKEMRRMKALELSSGDGGKLSEFGVYALLSIYKLCSGYGEAPFRALFALVFFIFLPFAVVCGFDFAIPVAGPFPNWIHFIPLVKLPSLEKVSNISILLMITSQVVISLQAALAGFALRNRFRR
ncbi:pentapeptide repeat-containing protein [Maridesulfovibrio sp.]|uniref:pentapeptide repeat-containing protein n=1 Tax=Maridesulfovibrio sp. TaxID=2795000 RepID=UPI003AFFCA9B